MSMIKIENLTFSYPTSYDNVFENVSFQVDTDWKLGFVGRNGRGKTTFLNAVQLLHLLCHAGKLQSLPRPGLHDVRGAAFHVRPVYVHAGKPA